jgi:tetratricopeptide (TPR) repeat protein
MQKIKSFFSSFSTRYLSSNRQVTRIIIFAVIALVLAVGSFAGYYWYDRYYSGQKTVKQLTIAEAEKAVVDDPSSLTKRLNLAEAYLVYQRYDDALAQANQVFASDPTLDRAWLVMGVANASNGHPADAITPLTNYVNKYKDEEMAGLNKSLNSAAYFLGDSYLQLGKYKDAIDPLEKVVGWTQTDADAMYKLGMAYTGVGRYEDAVFMFQFAVSFVPNFTESYQGMATAYEKLNKPGLVDYANGMVAYSQKDYPDGLKLLLKSAKAEPDFAPVFAGLGLTYEAMGDLKNAKASYDTAVSIDPKNYTATRGVARVAVLLNK